MKVVFKYKLDVIGVQIEMQKGAEPIYVDIQGDDIMLWALVMPDQELVLRTFEVYGTGQGIQLNRKYIGTVKDGGLVWHIFEKL